MVITYASAFITLSVESEVHQITISPTSQLIACDADGQNPQFERLAFTVTAKIGERFILPIINNNTLQKPFAVSGVSFYVAEVNANQEVPSVVLQIADLDDARDAYLCNIPVFFNTSESTVSLLGTATTVLSKYSAGADYALIELSNQTMQVACNNLGEPKEGQLGLNARNICTTAILYQGAPLKFVAHENPTDKEVFLRIIGEGCVAKYYVNPEAPQFATIYLESIRDDNAVIQLEYITYGNIFDPENALNYKRRIQVHKLKDAQKPNIIKPLYIEYKYGGIGPNPPVYGDLSKPIPFPWSDKMFKPTYEDTAIWSSTAEFSGDTLKQVTSWSQPVAIVLPEPKNVACSYFGDYTQTGEYFIRENFRTIISVKDGSNKVYFQSKLYNELDESLRNKDTGKIIFAPTFLVPATLSGGNFILIPYVDPLNETEFRKYWKPFQATFESLATGLLFAETAYIGNLTSRGLVIGSGDPNATDGWILDSSSIKSRALNGSTPFTELTTDGKIKASEAIISGDITATSGRFTGVVTVGNVGLDGIASNDLRIYAGTDYANRSKAPYRVTDDGVVYMSDLNLTGQVTGQGYYINENEANFKHLVVDSIDIKDGNFSKGSLGKWLITENGLSAGVGVDALEQRPGISQANTPTILSGPNPQSDAEQVLASVTYMSSTVPSVANKYDISIPPFTFSGINNLAKNGKKYSALNFFIRLTYTLNGVNYTSDSNKILLTGQDTASTNTPFSITHGGAYLRDVAKGKILNNLTFSVIYQRTSLSGNSTGSSRGQLEALDYKIRGLTLDQVDLQFYPITKTATLNPTLFELKKSDSERFSVGYETIDGVEQLVTTITGMLRVSGGVTGEITHAQTATNATNALNAVNAENANKANTATKADSATNADNANKLNNRSDYYHTNNANNSLTPWACSDLFSATGIISAEVGHNSHNIVLGSSGRNICVFNEWGGTYVWNQTSTGNNKELMRLTPKGLGIHTNNPTEALHVIGSAIISDTLKSGGVTTGGLFVHDDAIINGSAEVSGYVQASEGNFTESVTSKKGTFESLKAQSLDIYELTANQTRVTNGDLWIQDSAKITLLTIGNNGLFWFRCQDNVMRKDDLCIVQIRRNSGSVMRCAFKVTDDTGKDGSEIIYGAENISGDYEGLQVGDLIVRVGNATNKARQSSVLNCVSFGGYGAATIYYANVDSMPVGSFYPDRSKITSAMGDLRAIGYGQAAVYSTDGEFSGTLNSSRGRIANFELEFDKLKAKNIQLIDGNMPALPELGGEATIEGSFSGGTEQNSYGFMQTTSREIIVSKPITLLYGKNGISAQTTCRTYVMNSGSMELHQDLHVYLNRYMINVYRVTAERGHELIYTYVDSIQSGDSNQTTKNYTLPSFSVQLSEGLYSVECIINASAFPKNPIMFPRVPYLEMSTLLEGYELRPLVSVTYLADNGITSFYGFNDYFRHEAKGDFIVRKGNYALKVSTEGIKKSIDGGNIWSNV